MKNFEDKIDELFFYYTTFRVMKNEKLMKGFEDSILEVCGECGSFLFIEMRDAILAKLATNYQITKSGWLSEIEKEIFLHFYENYADEFRKEDQRIFGPQ